MLEPFSNRGSDIVRKNSSYWTDGGLMHRNADVGSHFQGHIVVKSDGLVPAGPGVRW